MRKRGFAVFGLVFVGLFLLSMSFVSADACSVMLSSTCASSGGSVALRLSALTNAHAELASQNNYGYVLCCDFTGTTTCDGTNKIIGLSAATNAHAEIPSSTTYGYDACFGDLLCTYITSPICPSTYPLEMISLSDTTNAHVAQFSDTYSQKICCQHTASAPSSVCGNGIVELGEQCDDGNTNSYDGCSNICVRESGYICDAALPTCCYNQDPSSLTYWAKTGQPGEFTGGSIIVGDTIVGIVPEKVCTTNPVVPSFNIYRKNYVLGIHISNSLIRTIPGNYFSSGTGRLAMVWIVNQSDLNNLGLGDSTIFFRTTNPNDGSTINSGDIVVTVDDLCGTVTCPSGQACNVNTGECITLCTSHASSACDVATGDVYWYDSCGTREGIRYDCTASQTCSNGQCVDIVTPPSCELTRAYWVTTSVTEGDSVQLYIQLSNCDGVDLFYTIMERDGIGNADDPVQVTPVSQVVPSGATAISATWIAEYQDDTDGGQTNPPEYYFTATIGGVGGQSITSSNLLEVSSVEQSYCNLNTILSCNDYDQAHCGSDTCNVAQNSVGSSIQCGRGFDCSCEWNAGLSMCVGYASQWPACGNGIINTGEQCETGDWGPITDCIDFGYTGGNLSCSGCVFDTSQCTGKTAGICGNSLTNTGEQCDNLDLPFNTCTGFDSFTGGNVTCNQYCLMDTKLCVGGIAPGTTTGKCSYTDTNNDTCDDGILERNIVAQWSGTTTQPGWCASYSDQLICPAQIKVPFFGTLQLIIAILLLIIIYYFIRINMKKKPKKEKVKSSGRKTRAKKRR